MHKKSLFCRLCAGILLGGLLLVGLCQATERVVAVTLAPDPLLSRRVTIAASNAIYLPMVQTADITVGNMGFEAGPTMWEAYSSNEQELILPSPQLSVPPHAGQWAARLGGLNNEISMLSQTIAITEGNTCLTYQVWVQSTDSCEVDFGGIGVNGKWHTVETLCAGTATGRWAPRHVDMEEHVSTALTPTLVLNFAASTDYSVVSTMFVDDVAFKESSLCDDSTQALHTNRSIDQLIGQQIGD